MQRTDEPTELHRRHQELDGLIRFLSARAVVEQQQHARRHLDEEEKQRHAADVVPDRMPMDWYLFLLRQLFHLGQSNARIQPLPETAMLHARLSYPSGVQAHHDPLLLYLDDIALQWPRRWACNILAVEIKVSVVTGAPDVAEVGSVLHDAGEMGADRRKGPQLARRGPDQEPRTAPEFEYLSGVRFDLRRRDREPDCPGWRLLDLRRHQIAAHRVQHRD